MVSASPRSAATAVTRVLGWSSNSGLMVRCSVASFINVHAIAVNWSASATSVSAADRVGVQRCDLERGELLGLPVTDVFADDNRGCVLGNLHPVGAAEVRRPLGGQDQLELFCDHYQVAVTDIRRHPAWVETGAGKDL